LTDQRIPPAHPTPVPLGRALDVFDKIQDQLQSVVSVSWSGPAGDVRRGLDLVADCRMVVATDRTDSVVEAVASIADGAPTMFDGGGFNVDVDRMDVTIHCAPVDRAGAELLHATGNAGHLQSLRERAEGLGHRLTRTGLLAGRDGLLIAGSEESIYDALDLPFIPPELRNGDNELSAAVRGSLPSLVSAGDIRGDLHMHSLWSDGRDPLESMVVSAIGLGYEYIAITDHSPTSAATRNLTVDAVERQADEIASLRVSYPQIAILHGCEVDVLEDGSLDFPDRLLERLDIVLASLHERHGHDAATLLRRYERAMRHPLVSVITHPTNRVIPHRPGYELDYDRLFQLAVETSTLVEIDGAPSHLDLDGVLAGRAMRAGVRFTIDSDCHIANRLGRQMQMGIMTARRGRVEARQVLNTRALVDVQAWIAAKRRGRTG
jgi:DNA polymerase (family 10)